LLFKQSIKVGNLIKIYGEVKEFGRTSVTLNIEVRKHNVYTGDQDVVTHTEIKFVRIDDDNNPIPISDRVKKRYRERIGQFGRGLLSFEELESLKKS
jgi:acyl-CoA thioesterase YciA